VPITAPSIQNPVLLALDEAVPVRDFLCQHELEDCLSIPVPGALKVS
jgi:hypothetical protein